MKTLMIFTVLSAIASGSCFWFFSYSFAFFLFFIFLALNLFLWLTLYNQKQRQKWQLNPLFSDSPQFDEFFWKLTISDQDWYIEHILGKKGLEDLIKDYETIIKKIWNDPESKTSEKMEKSSLYAKRLASLITTMDFNYGLRAH